MRCVYLTKASKPLDSFSLLQPTLLPAMKASVLAFFGLVATSYAAMVDIKSMKGVHAMGNGAVTGAAVADEHSGAASGATDGDGAVIGAATVGSAMSAALASPYL